MIRIGVTSTPGHGSRHRRPVRVTNLPRPGGGAIIMMAASSSSHQLSSMQCQWARARVSITARAAPPPRLSGGDSTECIQVQESPARSVRRDRARSHGPSPTPAASAAGRGGGKDSEPLQLSLPVPVSNWQAGTVLVTSPAAAESSSRVKSVPASRCHGLGRGRATAAAGPAPRLRLPVPGLA